MSKTDQSVSTSHKDSVDRTQQIETNREKYAMQLNEYGGVGPPPADHDGASAASVISSASSSPAYSSVKTVQHGVTTADGVEPLEVPSPRPKKEKAEKEHEMSRTPHSSQKSGVTSTRFANNPILGPIDSYFRVYSRQSSFGAEILGGVTMFMVTVYVLSVHPLYQSGIFVGPDQAAAVNMNAQEVRQLTTSTALVTGLATLSVGFLCNTPLVIAPGMGLNAFFVNKLVYRAGESWQTALGLICVEGLLYFLFTLLVQSRAVAKEFVLSIPHALRIGIGLGIGLFLGFLGLKLNTGVGFFMTTDDGLQFPQEFRYQFFIAIVGLWILCILAHYKVKAGTVLAMLAVTALSIIIRAGRKETLIAEGAFDDFGLGTVFGQLSFDFKASPGTAAAMVFILIVVKIFDVLATLLSVGHTMLLTGENEMAKHHREMYDDKIFQKAMSESVGMRRIFLVDAVWNVLAPVFGLSTTTVYIESIAAICLVGSRTGLASVVCGSLYLISIFVYPIVALIPPEATGILLFVVAVRFFSQMNSVEFSDLPLSVPVALAALLIPLSGDIAMGTAIAYITAVFLSPVNGQAQALLQAEERNKWIAAGFVLFLFVSSWLIVCSEMDLLY